MEPIWELFKAAFGLAADVSRDVVVAYWYSLKTLAKWTGIIVVGLLPLPIVGLMLQISWVSGVYLAIMGLLLSIWLIATLPIGWLVDRVDRFDEIQRIRRTGQAIGGLLFWILLLAMYFYLVPVWTYPAAIPLVLIICAVLALAFMRFGIGVSPTLAVILVIGVFALLTVSFYLPASRAATNKFGAWLDQKIATTIENRTRPTMSIPQRIEYDAGTFDRIEFFDARSGEPIVWYYRTGDGRYELFHGPGHHPQYGANLRPVTTTIVDEISEQLKQAVTIRGREDRKKQAEEERRRADKTREELISRYMVKGGRQQITVLVIDQLKRVNKDLTQAMVSVLRAKGVSAGASLFKSEFVSDGIFDRIFGGDGAEMKRLELSRFVDHLVLGRASVDITEQQQMESMMTARGRLEIRIIAAKTEKVEAMFSMVEVGAGFSKTSAEKAMIERIVKRLADQSWNVLGKGGV